MKRIFISSTWWITTFRHGTSWRRTIRFSTIGWRRTMGFRACRGRGDAARATAAGQPVLTVLSRRPAVLKMRPMARPRRRCCAANGCGERIMELDTPRRRRRFRRSDPDIRGAVTIRQQLDKHRADCHVYMSLPQPRSIRQGFAAGKLRCDGCVARPLPCHGGRWGGGAGFGKNGWPFHVPLRIAGRFQRDAAGWAHAFGMCVISKSCCWPMSRRSPCAAWCSQLTVYATELPGAASAIAPLIEQILQVPCRA